MKETDPSPEPLLWSAVFDYPLFLESHLEFVQQNFLLILLALGSGGALVGMSLRGHNENAGLNPTQATLLINREGALVVDVRTPEEYASGHLPEALNIPAGEIEARVQELEKLKDTQLILVCQTGARSSGACRKLEKLGFGNVRNLAGGMAGWRAASLPVRKGAKK
jgi:rhodanese-related sulfurtransferase